MAATKRGRAWALGAVLALVVMTADLQAQEGDAARGRALFDECAACHSLGADAEPDALGPPLGGILGRRAGGQETQGQHHAQRR